MALFTRSRKAVAAAAVAGSMLLSGGMASAALLPGLAAAPSSSNSVTAGPVKAEPAVFVSLLCQYYGRCSR